MAPKGDDIVGSSDMKLERLLSMKGGKGEASYLNNSQAQVSSLFTQLFPVTLKIVYIKISFFLFLAFFLEANCFLQAFVLWFSCACNV